MANALGITKRTHGNVHAEELSDPLTSSSGNRWEVCRNRMENSIWRNFQSLPGFQKSTVEELDEY